MSLAIFEDKKWRFFQALSVFQGYRSPLKKEDLWELSDRDACASIVGAWEALWEPKMDDYWRRKALLDDARQSQAAAYSTSQVTPILYEY